MPIHVGDQVVTTAIATVRSGAGSGYSSIGTVASGTQGVANLFDQSWNSGGWWNVSFPGLTGWVSDTQLALYSPPVQLPPSITNAVVSPAALPFGGGSVIITATVANATSITLDGSPYVLGTPVPVTLSKVFSLRAIGTVAPDAVVALSVNVAAAPPVGTFPQPTLWPILNVNRRLTLEAQLFPGRYERMIRQRTFKQATPPNPPTNIMPPLNFYCGDQGGTRFALTAPLYRLLVDGVERARCTPAAGAISGVFVYNYTGMASGDHLFTIQPCNTDGSPVTFVPPSAGVVGGECNVPFQMAIDLDGTAKNSATVVIQRSTHDWDRVGPTHVTVTVPKSYYAPVPQPRPTWTQPQVFTNKPTGASLFRYVLAGAPGEANCMTPHHLLTCKDGVQHTNTIQGYAQTELYLPYMRQPNLDGDRNVGTHYYNLFAVWGRNGKLYWHNPVAWGITLASGRRVTLFGKRDKYAPDWQECHHGAPHEEFVGVCTDSRVPAGGAYISGGWGGDWDYDSLALSMTAPPIGGEQPHSTDVVWFATDERGGAWKLVRDGQDPNRGGDPSTWAPTVGSLLIPFGTLNLPRFMCHRKGTRELIIGEAGANRIGRYNMDTGAFIAWVKQGTSGTLYGTYNTVASGLPRRFGFSPAYPNPTAVRAHVTDTGIVAPEGGVYYRDVDGEWIAWGSLATCDIRRVNLGTGVTQRVGSLTYSGESPGSQVVQIAVNDNTVDALGFMPRGGFGPHGSLAAVTFYHAEYGRPQIFCPSGPEGSSALVSGYTQWSNWHGYTYDVIAGRGPNWSNDVYPTAIAFGYGQLAQCGCLNGILVYRMATAADPSPDYAKLSRGHNYWKSKGYDVLGLYAFTPNGQRPWGENADCDYWMTYHGHN